MPAALRPGAIGAGMGLLALLIGVPSAAAEARAPAPLAGILTLDLADPIVTIVIGKVALRLRVRLDQHDVIELNTEAAARLGVPFEAGSTDDVGRIAVPSRVAPGAFVMNGRSVAATLSTHGRCCAGADGAISPRLLPYAEIRFVRAGAAGAGESRAFVLTDGDDGLGLRVAVAGKAMQVNFGFDRQETLATAAAGAILAHANGGVFAGDYGEVPVAFGISRPSRAIAFARPVMVAGFRFDAIRVRTGDYGGRHLLPREREQAGEIVVTRKTAQQGARPVIAIGRDRLDRCDEARFRPETLVLTLRCAFEAPAG